MTAWVDNIKDGKTNTRKQNKLEFGVHPVAAAASDDNDDNDDNDDGDVIMVLW
jgi:hypothetical protein